MMKNRIKLLSVISAAAIIMQLLPAALAADIPDEKTDGISLGYSDDPDSGISLMSLLPMDDVELGDVFIDRTRSIPAGLSGRSAHSFYVSEVLGEFLDEPYEGNISCAVGYGDDYVPVKWDDILELPDYVANDPGKNASSTLSFIFSGDQLAPGDTQYRVNVSMRTYADMLSFDFYNKDVKVQSGFRYKINRMQSVSDTGKSFVYSYLSYILSSQDFEEGDTPRAGLVWSGSGYHSDGSALPVQVYRGYVDSPESETELLGTLSDPENDPELIIDLNSNGYYYSSGLTLACTAEDGSRCYYPVSVNANISGNGVTVENIIPPEIYNNSVYTAVYALPDMKQDSLIGYYYLKYAHDFSEINTAVRAAYYNFSSGIFDSSYSPEGISYACFGQYETADLAMSSGKEDIKDRLFSSSGINVDPAICEDIAVYSEGEMEIRAKTADITVVDKDGMVYNRSVLFAFIEGEENEEDTLSDYTALTVSGASVNGKSLNSFRVYSSDDSYYTNGYQTLFITSGKGENISVAEGTEIYPRFSVSNGSRVYREEGEQISGQSPVTFHSGEAVQYSVTSENDKNLGNFWVTFITPQTNGAELFVNAANNKDHYSKNGLPVRNIFFNSSGRDQHDIFFANIGNEEMTDINVTLSDAVGVRLDEYWTVTDSSVKRLAPFKGLSRDERDFFAKLRLVPANEEEFSPISGTLKISSSGGDCAIELSGIAGVPRITRESIYGGVKYVPYSCVITTNNMFENSAMKFTLESGELPEGIVLHENGELYGIPMEAGEFPITVKASYTGSVPMDGTDYTSSRSYVLTIADNNDNAIDGVNSDQQGYALTDRLSRDITVFYKGQADITGGDPVYPEVDHIVIDSDIFRSEGSYTGEFMDFYIDGIKLTEGTDYTAEEGSTKITISAQTFGKVAMTDKDVPHTLAAEFRENKDAGKELHRSAQNVYISYVKAEPSKPSEPSDPATPTEPARPGTPSNPGSTGRPAAPQTSPATVTTAVQTTAKAPETVNISMQIVDENGSPVKGLSLELHSDPKYAKTDNNGMADFGDVVLGKHTLYASASGTDKKVSCSFTIEAGSKAAIDGNVITAVPGEKLDLSVIYDGSLRLMPLSVDVSAGSGFMEAGENVDMDAVGTAIAIPSVLMIFAAAAYACRRHKHDGDK